MIEENKQAYIESGIFFFDEKNPDVIADIQIKSEGEGSLNRAILTYATLFLVPSSSQTTYTVQKERSDFLKRFNTKMVFGILTTKE